MTGTCFCGWICHAPGGGATVTDSAGGMHAVEYCTQPEKWAERLGLIPANKWFERKLSRSITGWEAPPDAEVTAEHPLEDGNDDLVRKLDAAHEELTAVHRDYDRLRAERNAIHAERNALAAENLRLRRLLRQVGIEVKEGK